MKRQLTIVISVAITSILTVLAYSVFKTPDTQPTAKTSSVLGLQKGEIRSLANKGDVLTRRFILKGVYKKSSVPKISKKIRSIEGVLGVSLSEDLSSMSVTYGRGQLMSKQIIDAVSSLGFSASLPSDESSIEVLKFNISFQ